MPYPNVAPIRGTQLASGLSTLNSGGATTAIVYSPAGAVNPDSNKAVNAVGTRITVNDLAAWLASGFDKRLWGDYAGMLQALSLRLYRIVNMGGMTPNYAPQNTGPHGPNWATQVTVLGTISGETLTIDNAAGGGYANLHAGLIAGSFMDGGFMAGIGAEARLDGYGYWGRALVDRIVSCDEATTVLALSNPLPAVSGDDVQVWRENEPYGFEHIQPGVLSADGTRWRGCGWRRRDWTESLGNVSWVGSRVPWAEIDTDGHHWFCAKAWAAGVDLSLFPAGWCENAACPYYTANIPWRASNGFLARVLYGSRQITYQPCPGIPLFWVTTGWGAIQGLVRMAGIDLYATAGSWTSNTQESANGVLGYLRDSVEGVDNEYPFKVLETGAVGPGGTGVFAHGWPLGSVGNRGGNPMANGTDENEIMQALPFSSWPGAVAPLAGGSAWAGHGEAQVQYPVNRAWCFRGLDLTPAAVGVTQTDSRGDTAVLDAEGLLTLRIARRYWIEDLPIQARARTVVAATRSGGGNSLTLETIGVDYGVAAAGSETTIGRSFVTGGVLVPSTQDKRSLNYGAGDARSAFGVPDQAQMGMHVRFPGLAGAAGTERGSIIAAQAFGGAAYSGGNLNPAGTFAVQGRPGGAFYPSVLAETATDYDLLGVDYGWDGAGEQTGVFLDRIVGDLEFDVPDVMGMWHWHEGAVALQAFVGDYQLSQMLTAWLLDQVDGKQQATVRYRISGEGADRTQTLNLLPYSEAYGGIEFRAAPNVMLAGEPDLAEAMSFEYADPESGAWTTVTLTRDGTIYTGALSEVVIPAHGHYRICLHDGAYFAMLPPELWGFLVRITATYSSGAEIDPSAPPLGNGYPDDYETFRLNMDKVWLDITGCEALQAALDGGQSLVGQVFQVDLRGVMPPALKRNGDGSLSAAGHALAVYRVRYTGATTVVSAEDITSGIRIDRHNGILRIDTSGWTVEAGVHEGVRWEGKFLECPQLADQNMWTVLRGALRQLKAFQISIATGGALSLWAWTANPDEGYPEWVPVTFHLPGSPSPAIGTYGVGDMLPDWPEERALKLRNFGGDGSFNIQAAVYSSGSMYTPWLCGCNVNSAVAFLSALPMKGSWISKAYLSVSWKEGHYREVRDCFGAGKPDGIFWLVDTQDLSVPLGAYEVAIGEDGSVEIIGILASALCPLTLIDIDGVKWQKGSADITVLAQAVADDPPGGGHSIMIGPAGIDQSGVDAKSLLSSLLQYEYHVDANPALTYLESLGKVWIGEGLSFGGGLIELDHDGLEADVAPVFVGNAPTFTEP